MIYNPFFETMGADSGELKRFESYALDDFFDETIGPDGAPRPSSRVLVDRLATLSTHDLLRRQRAAERALLHMGITFQVYADARGQEKIFPFDIIPRVIAAAEWKRIEAGLRQRIRALNLFIDDIYHHQRILQDDIIPADLIRSCAGFRSVCKGLNPPEGIWCHITGTDLVRDRDGQFYVLEDNLRCPSGVSYVLENRRIMKNTFPAAFENARIRPVDDYPSRLFDMLAHLSEVPNPRIALLTPGRFNSAYFEHAFLAQQMGIELVEGNDLVVRDHKVFMRTTRGLERVDVLYRRIDDDFLDPKVFRPESMLGVPGIMEAYQRGNVALANAPGTGVADDKVIYAFVPDIIRYYLTEDPLLPNVPTYLCWRNEDRELVLDRIAELVVKPANESGGYGMIVGPAATPAEREAFRAKIRANPRNYIAQPTLGLSRAPVIVEGRLEGRHVDLRPYILNGRDVFVLPGGLTRVALKKGSLVVNSSQGGGSKDTWVLAEDRPC